MNYYHKFLSMFAIAILATAGLSACNTVEGAGEDIEAAGDAIEDSAHNNKGY